MSVNKAIIVGRLGKDPEVRHLDNGNTVASFSVATGAKYKNKNGQEVDDTEWHNIVLWNDKATIAEKYLKKGDQVYIEGKISTRSWEDQSGNKRYTTEIVGFTLSLIGGGRNVQSSNSNVSSIPEDDSDDLPF